LADTSIVVAPSMSLAEEDIQFIKDHLGEWLAEQSLGKPPAVYEIELRERMVRVEEELKHQRELIKSILVEMDKRFEAADKRFEALDKHFEVVDKRFETMQQQMDKRFDAVDKRFDAVDKRFDAVDRRFEELVRRIDRFMFWSFGLTVSVGALIVAALKLWP
jgi:chaperonin cofactor prefoldin